MVRHVNNDGEFMGLQSEVTGLLVVDFFATWCGPCQQIAPFFEQLTQKYPSAVFAKVDVDKCPGTAASQGVNAMPTFLFFVNKIKVDTQKGANPAELEAKVKKWVESVGDSGQAGEPSEVPGQTDLFGFFNKKTAECLNESNGHNLKQFFEAKSGTNYLESDCDEQLIINIPFTQPVKLHSLKIGGPEKYGPKTVKIFINSSLVVDFDKATDTTGIQTLVLTEKQAAGEVISLNYVKFQNVNNITLFIVDNQGKMATSRIDSLKIFGTPIGVTNMQEFKRVAGKPGEAH